ncbi:MAG: helix-turn-helix transcriptional regulator [Euzebya sp.]
MGRTGLTYRCQRAFIADVEDQHSHSLSSGFLRASLLLLLKERPSYGYELHERLVELGQVCDTAVVYRALHALHDEKLVYSAWEPSDTGPARRSYELSWSGEEALTACARLVAHNRDILQHYLDRCEIAVARSVRSG